MAQVAIKSLLSHQLLRQKPTIAEFDKFVNALESLRESTNEKELEEHNKTFVSTFLSSTFYSGHNAVNTAGKIDLAIYDEGDVAVIIESKSPTNKAEFLTKEDINRKALQELVLYFMRERFENNNVQIKHLIATNNYEWYVFDAKIFESLFASDKKFTKICREYSEGNTSVSSTSDFYKSIAAPKIAEVIDKIDFAYFDIRTLKGEREKVAVYKLLSPSHLLKQVTTTDSNALNTNFYNELLHIIGLIETTDNGKKVIVRKPVESRDKGSLLESTIEYVSDRVEESQEFDTALGAVIVWINRLLFLKLLESQLVSYHPQEADKYKFLTINKIHDFDGLYKLFFRVLAVPVMNRKPDVQEIFSNVPYLNSSLFEHNDAENLCEIGNLELGTMPLYNKTVLKDMNGHRIAEEMNTLEYLFRFLDAYDFGSEQNDEEIKAESKTLINASVLGLIFEKLNGYKDGSFFTPGTITEYMSKETLRRAVVQKFNEKKGWSCETLTDVFNKDLDIAEANGIINSLTICDPAVGSGHFLVSALNELITIKSELHILVDSQGKRIKDWDVKVENDELVIENDEKELFHYNPNNNECQRIQETFFNEKRAIIENCLFGVDINPNSVNICRLRLWIELLKHSYYRADGQLETLPNIDINIKCGNSLISRYSIKLGESIGKEDGIKKEIADYKAAVRRYKQTSDKEDKKQITNSIKSIKSKIFEAVQLDLFDEKYNKHAIEENVYSNSMEWMIEFPEVLDEDGRFVGFDAVIGNPPYIQLQTDNGKIADLYANRKFEVFDRSGDIYCLFYEQGWQLLKHQGILCYITSNKWMRAGYGEKTRDFFAKHTNPQLLIDFVGVKIFESATVDTNILLFEKAKNINSTLCCVTKKLDKDGINNLSLFVQQNSSICPFTSSDSWVILSPIEQSIKRKIEAIGTPLSNWNINIYRGVLTGYNEAFIINTEKREQILAACKTEAERSRTAELIRPILRGRDIKRYGYDWAGLWLINTHNGIKGKLAAINIEDFPAIKQHLDLYWDKISSRDDQGVTPYNLRNCAYMEDFDTPKIIYPETTQGAYFAFDDKGLFIDKTCFMLISENALYLQHTLSSRLFEYVYKNIFSSVELGANGYQYNKHALVKVPIYKPSSNFVFNPQQDINTIIYELYHISDEERKFIENQLNLE